MFLTTESFLTDYRIVDRLGIVYGISVYSRSAMGNFFGDIAAFFGGKQSGYIKLVEQNRNDALEKLLAEASALDADAVIGLKFDSNEFDSGKGQSMSEIVAYGTAVKLEKIGNSTSVSE